MHSSLGPTDRSHFSRTRPIKQNPSVERRIDEQVKMILILILSCVLKMSYPHAPLREFHDKLLLIIRKKPDYVDVLSALVGLNTRLDQITR